MFTSNDLQAAHRYQVKAMGDGCAMDLGLDSGWI